VPDDDDLDDLAIGYAVGTFGDRYRSLSLGLGLGDNYLADGFTPTPIVMVGGTVTLSGHVALVSENWLALDDNFKLSEQPFGLGVRFFGDRVSADVGLVLVPEYVTEGQFLPWASISYHFGPSHAGKGKR
jgi:hypothetical protein